MRQMGLVLAMYGAGLCDENHELPSMMVMVTMMRCFRPFRWTICAIGTAMPAP
ncbi:MAG: hypothetical protein ACLRWF_09145 [Ruthenibacterium sp.]